MDLLSTDYKIYGSQLTISKLMNMYDIVQKINGLAVHLSQKEHTRHACLWLKQNEMNKRRCGQGKKS